MATYQLETYPEQRFRDFREIVDSSAEQFGNDAAFQIKEADNKFRYISYVELQQRFYTLCNVFLEQGLEDRRIAVTGGNCFEWVLSYLCAATVGIAVPIDKELDAEDIRGFLTMAGCDAVCADASRMKGLQTEDAAWRCFSFSEVSSLSENGDASRKRVWQREIPTDKMQVLLFTSGTTGSSKGVCLSQYNICSDIYNTVRMVNITPRDKSLSILPLHHTYECTLNNLLLISRGCCIAYNSGLTRIQKDMVLYSPTVLVVVPALLKLLSRRLQKSVVAELPEKYKGAFEGKTLGQGLNSLPFIMRKLVCAKVRKALGGKLRLFIVGAAELDTSLVEDFNALGIRTLQGYGLTECSPLLAGNNDFYLNAASTGVPIPGVEIIIDSPNEDGVGEILAKGDNIMLGYYNDDEANAQIFRDGWFHTGDLGRMDPDGALYITGRLKNVIVTSNGKNIYPEELESRLSEHEEISEVLVMADRKDGEECIKAKILPNMEFLREKLGRLPTRDDINAAVHKAIADVNERIPQYKHIKVVEILAEALEKTTTQKIKRFGNNTK